MTRPKEDLVQLKKVISEAMENSTYCLDVEDILRLAVNWLDTHSNSQTS